MSHLEEKQYDRPMNNVSKKKSRKTNSLLDFIEDPKREESLIGMQYVVNLKVLDSDNGVIRCNLCKVTGTLATMKEHLIGINHIKLYMEKHYFTIYQDLKRSSPDKLHLSEIIKEYAKEIERAEGRRGIKVEYVSAADMKKEEENWVTVPKEKDSMEQSKACTIKMSHLEEKQYDRPMNNVSKKKSRKTNSLLDFIEDPKREESLIGMEYVVDVKVLDSDNGVIRCNLCKVAGALATMKEHLVGINHIKLYMEKHYFTVYQDLIKSSLDKLHVSEIIKEYAKEIERAEGRRGIKVEYVSAADMKKEEENWVTVPKERDSMEQSKSQVVDKRQMALTYSENFKISSREEANIVLNLTQYLSDQLEQYFFKYKGLTIQDSTRPDSISTKSMPASTSFPSCIPENLHPEKSTANQGMKSAATEMLWHTEDSSYPESTYSCSMPIQPENAKGLKRKPEESEDTSYKFRAPLSISSATESQSRKKSNYMEHYDFPTMRSSSSSTNIMVSPKQSSAEVSSSHSSSIADTYRKSSIHNEKVSKTFGGEMQIVKDTPQNSISQKRSYDNISNIKAVQETKSLNDAYRAKKIDFGAEENIAVAGPSCSTSNSSLEPSSEKPSSSSSSQPQEKTSKTLSPEVLQLLKGQDASTVTNILRTLSPFYPPLQDVNLEMLAQVLINTGVLD